MARGLNRNLSSKSRLNIPALLLNDMTLTRIVHFDKKDVAVYKSISPRGVLTIHVYDQFDNHFLCAYYRFRKSQS